MSMKLLQHPHLNPLPQGKADAERRVRASSKREIGVIIFRVSLISGLSCVFLGCEMMNYKPPVVSGQMANGKHGDATRLQEGRTLFAHRCIECHTLPVVWYYNKSDWPKLVDSMSARASLKPSERDAIVAYILATRAQM
jgi:hypothetical protein